MELPRLLIGFASNLVEKIINPASSDSIDSRVETDNHLRKLNFTAVRRPDPLAVSLVETVQTSQCSVRLKSAIDQANNAGLLPHRTLKDYTEDHEWGFEAYFELPDFGSRTVIELATFLDREIDRLAAAAQNSYDELPGSWSAPAWEEIAHLISEHRSLDDQYIWISAQLLELPWPQELLYTRLIDLKDLTAADLEQLLGPYLEDDMTALETLQMVLSFWNDSPAEAEALSPARCATQIMNQLLPHKSKAILYQRVGFDSVKQQTLNGIGESLGMSRERVRQIHDNAISLLNETRAQYYFKILLHSCHSELEQRLLGDVGCIRQHQLPKQLDSLGVINLAIRCLYGSLSGYADATFSRFRNLYIKSSIDLEVLATEFEQIDNSIQSLSLPDHLEVAASDMQVSIDALTCYVIGSKEFRIFDGFLHSGKLTPRVRRAIQLLKVLSGCLGGSPATLDVIYSIYRFAFPDAVCSPRDLYGLLYKYPEQMLSLTDAGFASVLRWCRIDEHALVQNVAVPTQPDDEYKQFGSDTTYAELVNLVDEIGPAQLIEIRSEFKRRFGNKWSDNSVYPILKTTHYFVRMAPGIVGTLPMLKAPDKLKFHPVLQSEVQVKFYVYAKQSQSRFSYPLWIPEVEYHWCLMGDGRLPWTTYESLLAVANPDHWPIDEYEKAAWRNRIKDEGRFSLSVTPLPLDATVPTVKEICTLALFIDDQRTVSWLDINRVMGNRIDVRGSMSYLAVLAKLGIVKLADNWLLPIEVCRDANYRFLNEIICSGRLNSTWREVPELSDTLSDFKSILINRREFDRLITKMLVAGTESDRVLQQASIFDDLDLT